jgi:hypothetical protein
MNTFEEKLATAMMAKLTGNVLKTVDESTTNPSSAGPANRIDPRKFIGSPVQQQQNQQHVIAQLNAEAERLYPLPSPVAVPPPAEPSPQQEFNFGAPLDASAKLANTDVTETLKSIDASIKKLVSLFEAKWQAN